jgi:uncharacterized OB-fold protein
VSAPASVLRADLDDALYGEYWRGLKRHQLLLPYCAECRIVKWPPRHRCLICGASQTVWKQREAVGVVHTFSVVHRPFNAAYAAWVPYTVVVVDIQAGVRLLGRLLEVPELVRVGLPVIAYFEDLTEGLTLLNWKAATA